MMSGSVHGHSRRLTIMFIFVIFLHFILSLRKRIFRIVFNIRLTWTIIMDTNHFHFHNFPIIWIRNLRSAEHFYNQGVNFASERIAARCDDSWLFGPIQTEAFVSSIQTLENYFFRVTFDFVSFLMIFSFFYDPFYR